MRAASLPSAAGDLKPPDLPDFKSVNIVLGNLKTTLLAGAFRALKYRKYGQHYLAASQGKRRQSSC